MLAFPKGTVQDGRLIFIWRDPHSVQVCLHGQPAGGLGRWNFGAIAPPPHTENTTSMQLSQQKEKLLFEAKTLAKAGTPHTRMACLPS